MKIVKALNLNRKATWIGLLIIVGFSCCNSSATDPFTASKFNPYDQEMDKRIVAYYNQQLPDHVNNASEKSALYIDFSSGINKAFNDPEIKGMMTDCFNTILSQKFDVYKLGSNQITLLNISNTTELGQQVNDQGQYIDIWAPIQKAVEKIVDGDNEALLITDFEEWQKNIEVTKTAYLKIPFSKWLQKGNSVHFFITDYKEGAVNKHLYFTVFSRANSGSAGMLSKLESKLQLHTTRFDLSTQNYEFQTKYPSDQSGGIFYDPAGNSEQARNVLDLKSNYINGLKNGKYFEFYPLGIDWENISQLHQSFAIERQFNDFFRKLFINPGNDDSYINGNYDVKVYDVTDDFEKFAKFNEAQNHRPKLTKGSNGENKFSDNQTDAIALACYNTDGPLKKEWLYTPQPLVPIHDVFTLNKTLFTNTKASDPKNIEIAVSFDPKFNVKNIPNLNGFIKADVVWKGAEPNLSNSKLAAFKWTNANKVENNALAESITNTLQELKPVDKTIYSYYIKTKQ